MALVVRLINLAISDFSPDAMLLEDAVLYFTTVSSGQTFLDNAHLAIFSQTERMPGYFLFLAAIKGIFGENFLPILVIQSVVDSVTCVMIGALGYYIYPKHWGIFGWLAAVWPNLVIHSGLILGDSLFVFFFVWFLLSFTSFLHKPTILTAVALAPRLDWQRWYGRQRKHHFAGAFCSPYLDYFKNEIRRPFSTACHICGFSRLCRPLINKKCC